MSFLGRQVLVVQRAERATVKELRTAQAYFCPVGAGTILWEFWICYHIGRQFGQEAWQFILNEFEVPKHTNATSLLHYKKN